MQWLEGGIGVVQWREDFHIGELEIDSVFTGAGSRMAGPGCAACGRHFYRLSVCVLLHNI